MFNDVLRAAISGRGARAGNLWGSSQALVLARLAEVLPASILAVVSTEAEVEPLVGDLVQFGAAPAHLPERAGNDRSGTADADSIRDRLRVAQKLAGPPERRPRLVVASQLSLLQPLPSSADMAGQFLHLQKGQKLKIEATLERLIGAGYTRQPLAERPGEISLRGDVLDVFGFAAEEPMRVELFDQEVESLRSFDPETQRSTETHDRVALCLASDAGGVEDGHGVQPASMMAGNTIYVEVEPLRLEDQRGGLAVRSSSHSRSLDEFLGRLAKHTLVQLQSLPTGEFDFAGKSVQQLGVGLPAAAGALSQLAKKNKRILVFCRTSAERDRLVERMSTHPAVPGLELPVGAISKGFRLPDVGLVAVNHFELAGVAAQKAAATTRHTHKVRALQSFFELRIGDLVVHAVHGLARYIGLRLVERSGGEEEHLVLEFEGGVQLFVPAVRVDLVQRYIGTGSAPPKLDRIGAGSFKRRKEKVEKALIDLAGDLLEVQAKRETQRRDPWNGDPQMIQDMLDAFPFDDTVDQESAGKEIREDLTGERSMDRLLCGDVGFGKTEVAMRAAFQVVAGGGQVAVLVPTTVLAEQHLESFRARLAGLPVTVAGLSRLSQSRQTKQTVADTAAGRVDILIGTHRILSKDVTFQSLGLIVVDEEQRFGVKHKEHFKNLRASVDVLTLSATPIPRTLHMSLAGVRDISALTVPPVGRQDCETKICNRDDVSLIRDVLLREKLRGGQTFFLHNHVAGMPTLVRELETLVPECKFVFGHGQMPAKELNRVMSTFKKGEADVLVATTIIENGIDIPAAGTILVDEAERYGLSELHQLRGRVGRAQQKSWCYLMVDRTKPMRGIARERLKALEEMSHLGAGFQISMKDLEIRGAGNLLGPEQSGHIAAIGYDMYCRLLKETVERLKSGSLPSDGLKSLDLGQASSESVELELGLRSYIPVEWVGSADERLELLRRMDTIRGAEDARLVHEELRDRFGRIPTETLLLLRQFRLRAELLHLSVTRVAWRNDSYLLEFTDRVALEGGLAEHEVDLRPLRSGVALLMLAKGVDGAAAGLQWLESLLQIDRAGLMIGTR